MNDMTLAHKMLADANATNELLLAERDMLRQELRGLRAQLTDSAVLRRLVEWAWELPPSGNLKELHRALSEYFHDPEEFYSMYPEEQPDTEDAAEIETLAAQRDDARAINRGRL